jgi:ribosome biogenesis GTPase / thiamine phosphate phosphatase
MTATPTGTRYRNHCPHGLWSLRVVSEQGDRSSPGGGVIEPVGIWVKRDREWVVFHKCQICTGLTVNRIAGDDNHWALISLALRRIAFPPFRTNKRATGFRAPWL